MDHYYSKRPVSESKEEKISVSLLGKKFEFITDAGVFSKNRLDFGTELLIETITEEIGRYENDLVILDMGCGYGPIGIILAKLFPKSNIHMADINERAIELSRKNIVGNNIKNAISYQSDLFENVTKKYDVIVTNPPIRAGKTVIYSLFEQAYGKLNDGGSFFCVIQKKQGAESAERKLSEIFEECSCINKKAGFRIIKAKKNSR